MTKRKDVNSMIIKQSITEMLDSMPQDKLIEVYNFIYSISNNSYLNLDEISCSRLSEPALSEDWNTPEEDEFWKDL